MLEKKLQIFLERDTGLVQTAAKPSPLTYFNRKTVVFTTRRRPYSWPTPATRSTVHWARPDQRKNLFLINKL